MLPVRGPWAQVRRAQHLRRIGFYLHKEFRGGRIGFYLPKEFRGDLLKKSYKKKACIFKKFSRCAGNLFIVILSTQRIPGGDFVENGSFIEVKVANVSGFSDSDGTIVCHTVKFKEIESL